MLRRRKPAVMKTPRTLVAPRNRVLGDHQLCTGNSYAQGTGNSYNREQLCTRNRVLGDHQLCTGLERYAETVANLPSTHTKPEWDLNSWRSTVPTLNAQSI